MRRRLFALALTAAAVTATLPATQAQASGPCTGVADTNCDYTRCTRNCFVVHCDVYLNPLGNAATAICL